MVHDIVCAHIIFIPIFILAAMQLPGIIQTWLLYHNALSADVVVSDILRYARKTQESGGESGENTEDMVEQILELKKIIQRQEEALINAGLLNNGGGPVDSTPNMSGVNRLLSTRQAPYKPMEESRPYGQATRATSMSGIDVWGNMAGLGDMQVEDIQESTITDSAPPSVNPPQTSGSGEFSFAQPDTMPPR